MQQRRWLEELNALRRVTDPTEILFRWNTIRGEAIRSPTRVKAYWDWLLYLSAFPINQTCYRQAQQEINQVIEWVQKWKRTAPHKWEALMDTGIPGTRVCCNYSRHLIQSIIELPASEASLHSFGASDEVLRPLWQALFPVIEFEQTSQGKMRADQRWQQLTGTRSRKIQLSVLLQLFDRLNLCDRVKDVLFDPMQVFVQWCPALFQLSAPNPAFASKQMIRQPDLNKIWHQPLPRRRDLSTAGRYSYMAIMRTVLAALHRETDPVTYADPESLECYDLGRGFRLVLVGMIPERRLSLDAYIGYMGFKNGVPVAYGGGWIWADQCKIGLNILPAFRGGESAWIFAQILRAYRQRFALRQFRVSPYQYGAGNPEGLRSGAFWLYYKLGFRPETNELKTLADGEWKKVTEQKGYRSPLDILKKFTQAPLICNQGAGSQMRITPAQVSDALSYWIVAAGSANRKAFIKKCSIQQGLHLNGLNKEQQETLALLAGWLIHQEYPESLRKQYLQACRLRWVDSEMNAVRKLALQTKIWQHWPGNDIPGVGYTNRLDMP